VAKRKPPRKANQGSGLYKPRLLVVAAALFWAGLNQPGSLTLVTLLLWALSAVTVGVLMRAALAVGEPLVKLAFAMVRQRPSAEGTAEEP
jgi:hypothetical protein